MSDKARGTGLLDFVADEARNAVREVRQRLFEEAWFGRVVTVEPVEVHHGHQHQHAHEHQHEHEHKHAHEHRRAPREEVAANSPAQSPAAAEERRPTFDELWRPGISGERTPERDMPEIER